MFCAGNAYPTVVPKSTGWFWDACIALIHLLDLQPMQKARNGRIAGKCHWLEAACCEAPMKRKGPVLSFSTAPQARSGRGSCSSLTLMFYDYKFHSTNLSYTEVR